MISGAILLLGFVTAQRLVELAVARRNTARLIGQGGREAGAEHYPLMVGFHALWLGGLWLVGWGQPVSPGWFALFLILQGARLWVMASLGPRWTTRIITLPGAPLVRSGPYRFLNHPNYAVVACEIAVLPLVLGLPWYALVFSIAHLGVLHLRIRAEERALAGG